MKRILLNISAAALLLTAGAGCRKYVEIPQVGLKTLHNTSDYQAMLANYTDIDLTVSYPMWGTDDVDVSDGGYQNTLNIYVANAYTWAPSIVVDADDQDWNKMYKQVYISNLLLAGVKTSDGGTDAQKNNIYAQALVHRAYAFYTLVNIYAKQYDAGTAGTDPGIPMLFTPNLDESLQRFPVQAVYDQVKKDLLAAIPDLDSKGAYSNQASQAAAYAILARASLQQGLYADAAKYADSTLARQNTLLNLEDYVTSLAAYPYRLYNPEVIFSKVQSGGTATVPLSNSLLQLFDATDLRYQLFTADYTKSNYQFTGRFYYFPFVALDNYFTNGPGVAEMMLIKAETAARAGDVNTALDQLNALRKHRFKAADYQPLTATTSNILVTVLNERRRELMARDFRWYDLKRLNKEAGLATTVSHHYKGQVITLEPNSNAYVFPIANKVIQQNPEIVQNPR